jgi:hypothetical protein
VDRDRPHAARPVGTHSRCRASLTVLAAVLVAVPAGCGGGHAKGGRTTIASKTFLSVADSYVRETKPYVNYGNNAKIFVDGIPTVRAYIEFQPFGLSRRIEHATLRLYSLSTSADGFQVRAASGRWSESRITFANAPRVGALINVSGRLANDQWVSIDVTRLVQEHPASVQVALVALAPTEFALASRNSPRHAPQLVIDYSG